MTRVEGKCYRSQRVQESVQPSLATERRPDALDNPPYPPRRSWVEEPNETCPSGAMYAVLPLRRRERKRSPRRRVFWEMARRHTKAPPPWRAERGACSERPSRGRRSQPRSRERVMGNNLIWQYMKRSYLHMAIPGCIIFIN